MPGEVEVDIRKNFFTNNFLKPWNRMPRAMVESLSLEGLKGPVDVAPGDTVQCGLGSAGEIAGPDDLGRFFHP